MTEDVQPLLDAAALNAFLGSAFADHGAARPGPARVVEVRAGFARLRLEPEQASLRPGGIVSGPTQMMLADTAAYAVILAHIGEVAMAVTSSLTYNFLRGVQPGPLFADAALLKLGRRLAVVDVRLWTDDPARPAGQASVSYMIP